MAATAHVDNETEIYDCRYKNFGVQVGIHKSEVVVHIREMRNGRSTDWGLGTGAVKPKQSFNRHFWYEGISLSLSEFEDLARLMERADDKLQRHEAYIGLIGARGRRVQVSCYQGVERSYKKLVSTTWSG